MRTLLAALLVALLPAVSYALPPAARHGHRDCYRHCDVDHNGDSYGTGLGKLHSMFEMEHHHCTRGSGSWHRHEHRD